MTIQRGYPVATLRGSPAGNRSSSGPRIASVLRRSFQAIAGILVLAGMALAQSSASSSQPQEVTSGGYVIHQSIEFGYRLSDTTGSGAMYDTLVNQHEGPRIFDQTFSMRSQTHVGLFDNLYVSSLGWGGDANNLLRARADKGKWYSLQATFRRDQNFFDYDLLANPLNPGDSSPDRPVMNSPHMFETRRRMSDVDLTLLPLSKISFRLGYSRNNMTGPSFSSVHEGTDAALFQPWNTTLNEYRMGVDWTVLPRTVLSYDQTLGYYKGDTDWQLGTANPALLPGGAGSVDLGLPFDTGNRIPCGLTGSNTTLIDPTGTLTNLACSAYSNYFRTQRVRTSTPTERLSLRSSYLQRLDLTASYSYSSADMTTPYDEFFNGLVSRTGERQFTITGPAAANVISNVAEIGATFRLTDHLHVTDNFYYWAYRSPGSFLSTETDWSIPGITNANPCRPPACSLLVGVNTLTPTSADTSSALSFNQKLKRNQLELGWDVTRKFGARIGYRYGDHDFVHVLDFLTNDVDNIVVHEQTALLGAWARPIHTLRLNFDLEHINYDNTIVRIAPRKESRYRGQVNYTPRPWAVVGTSVNLLEDHNGDSLTHYRGHYRNYGFNVSLSPYERFGLDFAYNYNDVLQNALICFNDTPAAGVTLPVVSGAGSCVATAADPNNPYNDANNPLLTDSYYENNTHYGLVAVRVNPAKRISTSLGYSVTSVGGKTPQFNVLQPLGSLAYNYHQPVARLTIDLGHQVSWNAGWNFYQYNEKSFTGPTAPRYFHTNNATLSLTYAF